MLHLILGRPRNFSALALSERRDSGSRIGPAYCLIPASGTATANQAGPTVSFTISPPTLEWKVRLDSCPVAEKCSFPT